jgi:hypothetical protein
MVLKPCNTAESSIEQETTSGYHRCIILRLVSGPQVFLVVDERPIERHSCAASSDEERDGDLPQIHALHNSV